MSSVRRKEQMLTQRWATAPAGFNSALGYTITVRFPAAGIPSWWFIHRAVVLGCVVHRDRINICWHTLHCTT